MHDEQIYRNDIQNQSYLGRRYMEPGWTLFNGQVLHSAGKNVMEQNNFTLFTFRWEWEQSKIQKKGSISHLF